MIVLEEIHQLPFCEKLWVMEAIWDVIYREEQHLAVPDWHKEELDEREQLLANGKAEFLNWEESKRRG